MSRYDYYYPPYIPLAEKKERNAKMAAKLAEKNANLAPVVLKGNKIATAFWGKAWCDNVASYRDYENRLPRGRSYVRSGAVLDLQISAGHVEALVAGSSGSPYKVSVDIAPLSMKKWKILKQKCIGKIASLLSLIQGKLPPEILKEFCKRENGLFPAPREIKTNCSCPDRAKLCKHLAAVFYGIGARLDENPALFFTLRKIDEKELLGTDAVCTLTDSVSAEIAPDDLENVFGVEFDTLPETETAKKKEPVSIAVSKKKKTIKKQTAKRTALPKLDRSSGEARKAPPAERFRELPQRVAPSILLPDLRSESSAGVTSRLLAVPSKRTVKAKNNKSEKQQKSHRTLKEIAAMTDKELLRSVLRPKVISLWTPERIRVLRKHLNLTQEQFAKLCSTSTTTVSFWENGKTSVSEFFWSVLTELARNDT